MAESLYVCHFSNGHIKVGRSTDPVGRIAAHADRVACLGVELVEQFVVPCASPSAPRETALIKRCTSAADDRHLSEWFAGLDYLTVCEWAQEAAASEVVIPASGTREAVNRAGGTARMAASLGFGVLRQNVEHWVKAGRIPPEHCCAVERMYGIPLWSLRPEDWYRIWPMLIGTEGAPSVTDAMPQAQQQAA